MLFVDSLKHEVTVGLRLHCQDLYQTQPNRLLEVSQPKIEKECAPGTRKALGDRYRGKWFTRSG